MVYRSLILEFSSLPSLSLFLILASCSFPVTCYLFFLTLEFYFSLSLSPSFIPSNWNGLAPRNSNDEKNLPTNLTWLTHFKFHIHTLPFTNEMFETDSFDAAKSTKGASKLRRDLINTEIANLRDLLPLPSSTRQRLSQLQLMALVCVYVRKANYFQNGELKV